jgi:CheY-like chemotaxis protein
MSAGAPFEKLSFLVVDDSRHMRLVVTTLLRSFGSSRVEGARDGAEAFDLMTTHQFDIVLADYLMVPVDGLEFVRRVRQSTANVDASTPIIMMSGLTERRRIENARDAGANEFLAKPMTAQTLFDRVVQVVNHPRAFIRSPNYIGPDRRRRDDPTKQGLARRWTDRIDSEMEDIEL